MTPRVTEEHKQAIHQQILRAAETLFAQKGYNATSMDDIVQESGLSKGAIYGHFDSKEALFLTIQEQQTQAGMAEMENLFSPDDTPRTKLEKIAKINFAAGCEVPEEVCRMTYEFLLSAWKIPTLQARLTQRYNTVRQFLVDIIIDGQHQGEFNPDMDPISLASILIATLDGLGLHRVSNGVTFDTESILDTFLKTMRQGFYLMPIGGK